MGFQAPSTAHYHLRKLVESGLVEEKERGYVVNRVLFEDMIRIGRLLIPIQFAFVAFFTMTLLFLLTLLRPERIYSVWALSVMIDCVSLTVFSLQAMITYRRMMV